MAFLFWLLLKRFELRDIALGNLLMRDDFMREALTFSKTITEISEPKARRLLRSGKCYPRICNFTKNAIKQLLPA